ncbi:MAG: hypothetical protein IJ907_05995 [Prevotella sp.]|nr:hypothetical protein [Prevotella sp.]
MTSIGNGAFSFCSGLTSATLSSDLGFIGERAFGNFEDLADVYCLADEVSTSSLLSHKGLYTYPNAFEDSYP